jgi:hypothetical protein
LCPLGQTFFGLTANYINSVYEQIFLVMMHGKFSFFELYAFPVGLRNWFSKRLNQHFEEMKK